MYSIVLATMLTAGAAAPAGCGVFGHGCCGYSCHGGCCFSSCCSYSSCCSCSGVYAYNCGGCGSWSYGCCSCCCGCWSYSGWSCCGCCSGSFSSCSFCSGCCFSSCCCSNACCGGVYYLPPYSIGCCCCGCVSNCSSVVVAPVCGVCSCYEPAFSASVIVPAAPALGTYAAPVAPAYQYAAPAAAYPAPAYPYAAPAATYPAPAYPSAAPGAGFQFTPGASVAPYSVPLTTPSATPAIVPGSEALPKKSPASADLSVGRVMIKAPLDVVIRVNGQVIRRNEAEMAFRTPALLPNASYSYEIEAELNKDGQSLKETKTVAVKPGVESVVDFNAGKLVARREATVTLNLPENARLFVDGAAYRIPTGQKTFTTPALVPGETYQYEMKAEVELAGKTIAETQIVKVAAGKTVTVDFNKINSQFMSTVSR